jgi:hypothetical protein
MWRERRDSKARDVLRDRQMTRASFLSLRMVAGYLEVIRTEQVLVAEGGFVPQSLIDSSELTDSTIVRNAKNGDKGKFFIQFSFSFPSFVFPNGVLAHDTTVLLHSRLEGNAVKERPIHDFKGLTRDGRPLSRWNSR